MAEELFGKYIQPLSKPITYDGKTYECLEMDYSILSGRDMIQLINEYKRATGIAVSPVLSMDPAFLPYVAARAAKVPMALFDKISFRDCAAIIQSAQNFMLAGFSQEEAEDIKEANLKQIESSETSEPVLTDLQSQEQE